MKVESFQDILREKMENILEPEARSSENHQETLSEEILLPFFTAPLINPPRLNASLKAYPLQKKKTEVATPVAAVPSVKTSEPVILKSDLSEDGKMKWFLFERMVGQDFPTEITRSRAMGAFRKFLKQNHPDLAQKKSDFNFATFVKIKNEFIAILEQQDPRRSKSQS
ncbi:MAG: hypothetical protein K2Q26_16170 [Bdellovibrionales bacterium]|nr:hypothetical protein [Bdellovibrionales bacterium]